MTSPDHQSGTDDVQKLLQKLIVKHGKILILLLIFRAMNHLLNLNRSIF